MNDPEWWRTAFAEHYADVYHHRDDASAAAEVAGLLPRLRAAPGPILDACCGGGRHLAAMRDAGLDAYGFDFSAELLAQARKRPQCTGRVVRGDLRAPPFAGGFGAITLLFTAFGYFDDAGNAECLAGLARLLAPGGLVVLDLPDPGVVARSLVADSQRTTPGGLTVVEKRWLGIDRVEKTVRVQRDAQVLATWQESVRLYQPSEILKMAGDCGLNVVDCWPGLHGPDRREGRAVHWLRSAD